MSKYYQTQDGDIFEKNNGEKIMVKTVEELDCTEEHDSGWLTLSGKTLRKLKIMKSDGTTFLISFPTELKSKPVIDL